jgi:hypothetical protein
MIGATLCFLVLNLVDVGRYIYTTTQVGNAAQMGAQAALSACDVTKVPATTLCSSLNSKVTAAIQSTSLGGGVALGQTSPSEGYYCINSLGALQYMSSVSSKPTDCSQAGTPSLQPVDYLSVSVTANYAPLFGDFTVARLFAATISASARVRMSST